MNEGLPLYGVWMKQEASLIQEVAKSFGEVMSLDYFINTVITHADQSIMSGLKMPMLGRFAAGAVVGNGKKYRAGRGLQRHLNGARSGMFHRVGDRLGGDA